MWFFINNKNIMETREPPVVNQVHSLTPSLFMILSSLRIKMSTASISKKSSFKTYKFNDHVYVVQTHTHKHTIRLSANWSSFYSSYILTDFIHVADFHKAAKTHELPLRILTILLTFRSCTKGQNCNPFSNLTIIPNLHPWLKHTHIAVLQSEIPLKSFIIFPTIHTKLTHTVQHHQKILL